MLRGRAAKAVARPGPRGRPPRTHCQSGAPYWTDRGGRAENRRGRQQAMADTRLIHGRYRLLEVIGRGGMGEVWRATDEALGRRVAVKCLKPLGPQHDPGFVSVLRERFRREARVAASLQHRGVTVVHDFGECEGSLFLVMELLQGRNLSQLLEDNRHHPLPLPDVVDIAEQVADALAYTHRQGIVHRDLKPANIVRLADGGVKICDFGIARPGADTGAASRLTSGGIAMGTPHYMSPEQISGGQVDHRSDLYSLGCVLYEIATGSPPFDQDDAWAVLVGHRDTPPVPLRAHRAELPPVFERIVLDLLAKAPEARPADAGDLHRRITGARGVVIPAPSRTPHPAACHPPAPAPAADRLPAPHPALPAPASLPAAPAPAAPGELPAWTRSLTPGPGAVGGAAPRPAPASRRVQRAGQRGRAYRLRHRDLPRAGRRHPRRAGAGPRRVLAKAAGTDGLQVSSAAAPSPPHRGASAGTSPRPSARPSPPSSSPRLRPRRLLLPIATAPVSVGIAHTGDRALGHVMTVADFAPMLGMLIGLGVGIDYALHRHPPPQGPQARSQRRRGRRNAVATTARAGRRLRGRHRLHRAPRHADPQAGLPQRRRHSRIPHRHPHRRRVRDAAARVALLHRDGALSPPRAPPPHRARPAARAAHRLRRPLVRVRRAAPAKPAQPPPSCSSWRCRRCRCFPAPDQGNDPSPATTRQAYTTRRGLRARRQRSADRRRRAGRRSPTGSP